MLSAEYDDGGKLFHSKVSPSKIQELSPIISSHLWDIQTAWITAVMTSNFRRILKQPLQVWRGHFV